MRKRIDVCTRAAGKAILSAHLKAGRIFVESDTYIGIAADGKEVQIGEQSRPGVPSDETLSYLLSHPDSADW